jgi:endo-1,4-beta-xylanase
MRTARWFLTLVAVVSAATLTAACSVLATDAAGEQPGASGAAVTADREAPLRALAAANGIRIGTSVGMSALTGDATYRAMVATEFSSVTPEVVMKWGQVEPERGTQRWQEADALVAFAERNGQLVRGHTLVWDKQVPDWVDERTMSRTELRSILRRHVQEVVGHFHGRVRHWDVVNEAFDDQGRLKDTVWLRALGPGYIADAFRWAHEADPGALLYYNDNNISWFGSKSDAVYEMVRELRADGVPIHGVGFQGHLGIQYGLHDDITENYQRFSALGIRVAVTEADVRMVLPVDQHKLTLQTKGYTQLLQACLSTRTCDSFTVWGFTDRYSWVPQALPGQGAAALWDAAYQPKPALRAVRQLLSTTDLSRR